MEDDKRILERQNSVLEIRKIRFEGYKERIQQENGKLSEEYDFPPEANRSLAVKNKSLATTSAKLSDDVARLQMKKLKSTADADFEKYKAYCPVFSRPR